MVRREKEAIAKLQFVMIFVCFKFNLSIQFNVLLVLRFIYSFLLGLVIRMLAYLSFVRYKLL